MKTLRQGINWYWWIDHEVECQSCKSILKLEKGDKVRATNTVTIVFQCPECEVQLEYNKTGVVNAGSQ